VASRVISAAARCGASLELPSFEAPTMLPPFVSLAMSSADELGLGLFCRVKRAMPRDPERPEELGCGGALPFVPVALASERGLSGGGGPSGGGGALAGM